MLDLLIIGGSAAGCSAAIYASRRKLNFKLITNDVGGEVVYAGEVKNWLGSKSIYGYDLAQNFAEHVRANGVEIEEGWKATTIKKEEIGFSVEIFNNKGETRKETAKSVIIATGIHPRHLGAKNEESLFHKGVTYCTVCDGPLFKNKTVAVLGGGNAALEAAIMMSGIAKKVYLTTIEPDTKEKKFGFPTGDDILIEKVQKLENVEIIHYADTFEFTGENKLTGLKYRDLRDSKNEEKELAVEGAMIHVGMVPNSDFIDIVEKDRAKQIITDRHQMTSVPGIFAAGDVTDLPYKQIIVAAGQGSAAALAAIEYLNKQK